VDSERIRSLLDRAGLESHPSTGFRVDGGGGVLRGRHAIDEAASVVIGLSGAAAADLHEARDGESQMVSVDIEEAASAVSSIDANTIDGKAIPPDPPSPRPLGGISAGMGIGSSFTGPFPICAAGRSISWAAPTAAMPLPRPYRHGML
jgi:hypothetical protein